MMGVALMDPATILIEHEAAILQAALTIGLALLFALLYHRGMSEPTNPKTRKHTVFLP